MKMIKIKNQEIQKLKTNEVVPKEISKETPLNKSNESKSKETISKIEKELQKVKADLK